jgi:PAS domain S-box-containing protein
VHYDETGKPVKVTGTAQDITERKRAEEALREAESRYRALVEQLPAIIYINALDGPNEKLYVSPQIESILGVPAAEWTANPMLWVELLHPDDRERAVAEVTRSYASGEPLATEYRMRARDGRVVWFHDEAVAVRDETRQPRFHHGVMLDITERKAAEEELERRSEKLREQARILDLAPVLIRNLNDEILLWNTGAEQMYGWSKEEAMGRVTHDLLQSQHPEPADEIKAKILSHGRWEGEIAHTRRDGVRVRATYSCWRDSAPAVTVWLVSAVTPWAPCTVVA